MRTILVFVLAAGCTEQNYPSETQATPPGPAETGTTSPAAPTVHSARYEWAAGACDPVSVPVGAIVQLLDCQDMTDGVHQCWPDADGRLTLIDGTAFVLCPEDDLSPDSYTLTVISVG